MKRGRKLRRGIYLIPTAFTLGNLFCGYSSLVHSSLGQTEFAAMLILVAAVLDGLDGRIARLTGTTSEFGVQFDSLADVVSFGLAPALLIQRWGLAPIGRIGWALAFLFVAAAAMRLARYNIRATFDDKRYFAGLPSPMAGCSLAATVFAFPEPPGSRLLAAALAVWASGVAVLMISRLRYRSFREFDLRSRRSYVWVLPLAGVIVAVAIQPSSVIAILFLGYSLSAPLFQLGALLRRVAANRGSRNPESREIDDEPAIRPS